MEKFKNQFTGENYLSYRNILQLKNHYKPKFEEIKRKKYLLIFPKKRKFYFQYKNISLYKEKNNLIYLKRKMEETMIFLSNIKGYSYQKKMLF